MLTRLLIILIAEVPLTGLLAVWRVRRMLDARQEAMAAVLGRRAGDLQRAVTAAVEEARSSVASKVDLHTEQVGELADATRAVLAVKTRDGTRM